MRLIDADALNDAMFRKSFETDDGRQKWDSGLWIRYKVFEEARDETPTKDAVPVVRCKDCKHCEYAWNRIPTEQAWVCYKLGIDVEQDWFCADGERKDNE